MKLAQLAALASFPSMPSAPAKSVPASLSSHAAFDAAQRPVTPDAGRETGRRLAALDLREPAPEPASTPHHGRFDWGASWGAGAGPDDATATNWAVAPAYDDEHPEELSYRPFPIAPYLTETSSPDDPALARMEFPDVAKTLELLDRPTICRPMLLRPGPQTARLLWAQQFRAKPCHWPSVFAERPRAPSGLAVRAVRVSSR